MGLCAWFSLRFRLAIIKWGDVVVSDTSGGIYLSEDINGSNFIEFYRNLTRLAVIALLMSVGFINEIDWGREKSAIGDLTNKENWLKILAFLINTRSPDALNASKNLIAAMVRRVDLLQCSPASILCSTFTSIPGEQPLYI